MGTKFSEDVIPIADLKLNPGRVLKHTAETRRPVLLTSRGRGVAVVQSLAEYEQDVEARLFMQSVVKGLVDAEEGREVSIKEVKKRFGIK